MRRAAALAALFVALASVDLAAQVRTDLPWRTIETQHFRVHFTPELEPLARRAAAQAELIHARLARELPPPRGVIDLVVTDHVDYANGSATPFPSNRVIIHARPPIDDDALRVHADWTHSLLVHELTHAFQIDRVNGWWRVAQTFFGRAAPFFPELYAPSWLLEGIAVHNESRLAPGGRLGGTEFEATVRALARDSLLPPLDGLSLARPFYPGGSGAYLIGAELVTAALAREPADDGQQLNRLMHAMATSANPWQHNRNARSAFGASFVDIHAAWRDSVMRGAFAAPMRTEIAAAKVESTDVIATPGWTARHPRYRADGSLLWVGDDARRNTGLFTRRDDGSIARTERRNSIDAAAPLGDRTVYAEFDFTGLYELRNDLYIGDGDDRQRLTHGARLSSPDVHAASRRVVAVRTIPGSTELVTLSLDDRDATPTVLAAGSLERNYSDPRFSPSGTMVAAVLWEHGGRASIVVLDASSGEERVRFSPRARTGPRVGSGPRLTVVAHPAWIGDTLVVFTSDHDGAPFVYRGDARTGAYGPLWITETALHTPDVSPDGTRIVAVELHGEGFRVVERAMPDAPPMRTWLEDSEPLPAFDIPEPVTAPARPYSPKSTVGPTWWLPSFTPSDIGSATMGFFTTGQDVIGRHFWRGALSRNLEHPELSASLFYTYAGFGNPALTVTFDRAWQHAPIVDGGGNILGYLAERSHAMSLGFAVVRPRVRVTSYLFGSASVEDFAYQTYPNVYLAQLEANGFNPRTWRPTLYGTAGISTMQRPQLAVSVADGATASVTTIARIGDQLDDGDAVEVRLRTTAAKSLPLPGYARPVVAVRAAIGVTSDEARQDLSVGGMNGGSLELIPGVNVGGDYEEFFVRGTAAGAQRGTRAMAASAEYRMPITRVGRGLGFVPLGLATVNAVVFADAGAAWCEREVVGSPSCEGAVAPREFITSAGAELHFDALLRYDFKYRFRFGVARVLRGDALNSRTPTFYFTVGDTF